MTLQSKLFKGDPKFEACLVQDSAHIVPGSVGDHVAKIQMALSMVDDLVIDPSEKLTKRYGPSTAAAVLNFKKKRKIINFQYQTREDNIVGKMTIGALDAAMFGSERRIPSSLLLLAFALSVPGPGREIVLSVSDGLADVWARQFIRLQPLLRRGVLVGGSPTVAQALTAVKSAIIAAGNQGVVIFNVGHGGTSAIGNPLEGTVELAPNKVMKLGGANSTNVFVNVFYDVNLAGPGGFSQRDNDLKFNQNVPAAQTRLANFAKYQEIGATCKANSTRRVIFLTCKVGKSVDFLKKIAADWDTVVEAYTDQVALQAQPNGRVRMFLFSDPPGTGTNIPLGEEQIPLPTATNSVRVGPAKVP